MKTTTFFFSSRRRHTRYIGDWSSDVCSSDLTAASNTPSNYSVFLNLTVVRGINDFDRRPFPMTYLGANASSNNTKTRSEERRVGKESRYRGSQEREKKKIEKARSEYENKEEQ